MVIAERTRHLMVVAMLLPLGVAAIAVSNTLLLAACISLGKAY